MEHRLIQGRREHQHENIVRTATPAFHPVNAIGGEVTMNPTRTFIYRGQCELLMEPADINHVLVAPPTWQDPEWPRINHLFTLPITHLHRRGSPAFSYVIDAADTKGALSPHRCSVIMQEVELRVIRLEFFELLRCP